MPPKSNVLREWTFWIRTELCEECRAHLDATKLPELKMQPGCQRATALFRDLGDGSTEVMVVSTWDTMDSIRAFAGDAVLQPTIAQEDRSKLIDRESVVRHYLVADHGASGIMPLDRARVK